jgi:hypothetical protein
MGQWVEEGSLTSEHILMHFFELKPFGSRFPNGVCGRRTAKRYLMDEGENYAEQLRRAMPASLRPSIRLEIDEMLGLENDWQTAHASNCATRAAVGSALIETALRFRAAHPDLRYKLITFKPDAWHVDSMVPRVALLQSRAEVARWMRAIDFYGTGAFELTPLLHHPFPGGDGDVLSWHFHGYGYIKRVRAHKQGLSELRERNAAFCSIDKGIDVRSIRPTRGDHARASRYILKHKPVAKRIVASDAMSGGYEALDTRMSGVMALRVSEILSCMSIQDLIVTRGEDGWAWRQGAIKACGDSVWRPSMSYAPKPSSDPAWAKLWAALDVDGTYPVRIDAL